MLRIRVAAAESKLKVLREQAREAKRRRKEAKRKVQSARKRFKQSKADLSELREALAAAEAKLFKAGQRALTRRMRFAKRKAPNRTQRAKPATATHRRRSPAPAWGADRKSARAVTHRKPARRRTLKTAKPVTTVIATDSPALNSTRDL